MSATSSTTQNPFEAARSRLIERLATVVCPKAYRVFPSPDDHLTVRDHVKDVLEIVDSWFAAIGDELAENAVTAIDRRGFDHAFVDSVEGDALYAFEREAEVLSEGRSAA